MTKPISTAVISYGMSGRVFHCPLIANHNGFSLYGIVNRKSSDSIPLYPKAKIFRTVEDVIQHPDIELIVINIPNEFHFDFASKALKAGKHIVVEKPFTVTSKEAEGLIELSKETKRTLTVFQNRRWDGDFLTVKKVLEEKRLGRIVEFEGHYDRFRNYIQPNTWKEEQSPGNGILYNLGSHMIDQALSLFGVPDFVDARVGIQRTGGKVDDYYDIRMEYKSSEPGTSPLLVILKSSYLVREPGPRYVIHGEKGSFVKSGLDPQEQALAEGKIPGSEGWGIEPKNFWGKLNTEMDGVHFEGPLETVHGNYLAFYENVYQSIRDGKPLAVKPEESLAGIKVIEACVESNKLKKAVRITS
jgi:scyllo-inositol 2-dehydrogenase (NADP+)